MFFVVKRSDCRGRIEGDSEPDESLSDFLSQSNSLTRAEFCSAADVFGAVHLSFADFVEFAQASCAPGHYPIRPMPEVRGRSSINDSTFRRFSDSRKQKSAPGPHRGSQVGPQVRLSVDVSQRHG